VLLPWRFYGAFHLHTNLTLFSSLSLQSMFSVSRNNRIFCGILLTTAVLQAHCRVVLSRRVSLKNGLRCKFLAPVPPLILSRHGWRGRPGVINVFYRVGHYGASTLSRRRIARNGAMTTMQLMEPFIGTNPDAPYIA
jgi:hypothetical protein